MQAFPFPVHMALDMVRCSCTHAGSTTDADAVQDSASIADPIVCKATWAAKAVADQVDELWRMHVQYRCHVRDMQGQEYTIIC